MPLKPPSANLPPMDRLLDIMASLRNPDGGCPWDIEQTFETIAPHTVEEAYEVADAIHRGDMDDLREELGDLLLQVVFHAQMAAEKNLFAFDDVVTSVVEKLIFRHPHVFGDASAATADDVTVLWDARKAEEKSHDSAIDGVTLGLPSLLRAQKLQKKAAKSGFVWPNADSAWEKLEEELQEFKNARTKEEREEELGDLLYSIVNYARMQDMNCEEVLSATNRKFEERFKAMESVLTQNNKNLAGTTLEEKMQAWNTAKAQIKQG